MSKTLEKLFEAARNDIIRNADIPPGIALSSSGVSKRVVSRKNNGSIVKSSTSTSRRIGRSPRS